MAGFLNGSGFEGTAPPQQAVEQAPNPVMAGVGQLFDLLASGKKGSGSSADQRAEMAIASRGTFLERLDEIKQLQLQGQNVRGLVRDAYQGAISGGMKASEIGGMAADFGIDLGEINSTVGEGSPHDYNNQEPPPDEFTAFYGAAKMQNPSMSDEDLYAMAKKSWVNNKLYEDESQWKTLSSNQAWEASKDFAYGNANMAFWEIVGGDLNETAEGGGPDNQVSFNTLAKMKTLIGEAKSTMKSRWAARNEEEGGSSRDTEINKLFWQFDQAIEIAEEGMLLAPNESGKAGPNYRVATWVMTQNGSDIAAMINRYAKSEGVEDNVVSADGNEFDPNVKTKIANWMKAFTLGTGREGEKSNRLIIEGELSSDESITGLLGMNVPETLTYIYNAVIEEGTPEYLKGKREEISALAEVMGWSLESPNGVDPAAATGDGSGGEGTNGEVGERTNGAVGEVSVADKKAVADVHPLVLFASELEAGTLTGKPPRRGSAAERTALAKITKFYDNGKILGGLTKEIGGKVPQIVAWQGYESATPKVQKAMENQVDAAGEHLAHVLKTVISMDINGIDGKLQEKVMGSERMVNIIRAMNSSGVPGARQTAVALAHMQGQAANKVVTLNGKYFESIAKTLEGTSYGKIIKPSTDTGPVEINLQAFTNSSLLESFDVDWDYDLTAETPDNLRTLLSEIREKPQRDGYGNVINTFNNMTDHELIKVLAAEGLATGGGTGTLRLISSDGDGYKWNNLNSVVGEIGLDDDGTLAGLTANQYAAVMTGIKGISTQLQKYEEANAGRQSAFNAMEGAKALWTELTGQGFTEDGAPMVSLEEAAAGVKKTPDAAADTAAEAGEEPVKEEDFGTFLQQFARERGYSEEEIAKTVADINAAGGSAAYIKAQKEENPAYFHEDVAAAIAAKPDDLWIKGEDGKLVQNPDADVEEARNSWELGVLDALRKIDPAFTLADAKEAAAVATAVEASETPQRTPDELKVALEKGEIDQATFDAEMAKMTGSPERRRTPDELKVALEKGEIDQATFDAEMAKMSGSAEPGEVVEGILDDKITTTVLPDEATEELIKGAEEAITASEVAATEAESTGGYQKGESKKVTRELYEQGDVKTLEKLVGFGDPNAQYQLGRIYENGKGVTKDDAEAIRLYRLAAEQGNAFAQYSLGWMYEKGEGVPKDDAEAVRWFRLAAEQGNARAQNALGRMELGKAEKRLATMPVTKRLIERVESKPGLEGYKTLWANWEQPGGRYEGTDITTMSLGQLFKFADDGYHNANNLNSAPFGKFQFLDSTLKDLINRMPGITEGTVFTPENQLAMFTWYAKDRLGNRQGDAAVSKLIAIWEGLGKDGVAYDDILQMASEIRGTPTEPPVPVKYTLPADTKGTVGVGGITVAVNSISRKNQRGESFNAPPIFGTSGEHSHTPSPKNKPYAEGNMQKLMAKNGPFHRVQAKMNNLFPNMGPVRINDALVHAGSTRESARPPTRTKSGSQHFHGTALDVSIAGMSKDQKIALWKAAYEEGFRGFGFGTNILHMDMGNARIWGYGDIAKKEVWEGISFKGLRQGIVSAGPRGGDNFTVGARSTFEGDTGDRAVEDKEGKQGDVDVISLGDYVLPQGIFGIPGMTAKSPEEIFFGEEEYVPGALADDFGDPSAEDSDEEVPFMRRPSGEQLAGPDAELKDRAWRKLEESEIEELIEVSEGDSGLKDQAGMSLGNRYQNGRGVPKDKDKAREYYEGVVINGGELAEEATTALESIDAGEALQLMSEQGRGAMIQGEPYILLPGGVVVRGRDGEVANDAVTALVKKRLHEQPK